MKPKIWPWKTKINFSKITPARSERVVGAESEVLLNAPLMWLWVTKSTTLQLMTDAGRQNVGSCMQNYQLKLGMLQSTCVKYGMMCTCELGAFQLKILAAQ